MKPLPHACPVCGNLRARGCRSCTCGFDFTVIRAVGLRAIGSPIVNAMYLLLAIDVGATALAATLTWNGNWLPASALRDVLILVHITIGTINGCLLHRLLFSVGADRSTPLVMYLVGLVFCFPAQWAVLVLQIIRWKPTTLG